MGTLGALNAAPEAPFPRKAREIPPKAGISGVCVYDVSKMKGPCVYPMTLFIYVWQVLSQLTILVNDPNGSSICSSTLFVLCLYRVFL